MQPEDRITKDDDLTRPAQTLDWDRLRVPGKNGVLSVVTTVRCWGVSVLSDSPGSKERVDWDTAVGDVSWALEQMLRTPEQWDDDEPAPTSARTM